MSERPDQPQYVHDQCVAFRVGANDCRRTRTCVRHPMPSWMNYSDDDMRGGADNGEAGPSGLSLKENRQPPLHTQPGPSKGAKAARPGLMDTRGLTAPKLKGTAGGGGTTFQQRGHRRAEERHAAHILLRDPLPGSHAGYAC